MRRSLYRIYWRLRKTIAPTLKYSQYLYEDVLKSYVNEDVSWLDLGCGHQILPSWRAQQEKNLVATCGIVVGIDYDLPSLEKHPNLALRIKGDITRLPFRDDSFDIITANMVVEHLSDPETQFREISRVLKPQGVFIFHTPNAAGYFTVLTRMVPESLKGSLIQLLDGRKQEDVFPAYYRANKENVINRLAADCGLQVVKIRMIVTDAVFGLVPPMALFELVWIRLLLTKRFRSLRTNIIAILRKNQAQHKEVLPTTE